MQKYFIYCRKSSEAEDRQVLSIESQASELKTLTDKLNLSISAVLTEAKSAKEPGRPVFNAMMQRIYRGEAQGILCWKLDRLARNPVDGGSIIWAIKQQGIKIITPTQTFSQQDDNTILMYIEFGMAQKYIDDLSRNVKRGLKAKLEKGWHPGVAPLGYLNNTSVEKGERTVIADPLRFPLIRKMWDLMLSGNYSPAEILRITNQDWGFKTRPMKKLGNKPLSRSGIYRLFTNPFYFGWFECPRGSGRWYQGAHEPMITQEEYDHVQLLLGRKGKPRPQKHVLPFTGLIRCGECEAMVTAEEKHQMICSLCRYKFAYRNKERCPRCDTLIEKIPNPTRLHYTYYRCTKMKNTSCSQGAIEAKELERQIDNYLTQIQISEKFKEWAIKQLRKAHGEEVQGRNAIVQSQQKAYQDCMKRLDNLIALKTSPLNADGDLLSDEEYAGQRLTLLKEKTRLEELFRDTGHRVDKWLELSEKTFEFARSARYWFAQGDPQTKREILAAIGSNLTLKDKKLIIKAKNPFLILEKSIPGIPEVRPVFEPEKSGFIKTKTEALASASPTGRGERDDVRTYGENLSAARKANLIGIVNKIWQFFKGSKDYLYIPIFNEVKAK